MSERKGQALRLQPAEEAPTIGEPSQRQFPAAQRSEATARRVEARVAALIETIERGRIYEAVDSFYAPDVALGRGALAPMFGLDLPAARRFLRRHIDAEWCGFEVHGVGVNGDTSFIECSLEFAARNGERTRVEQVAVAQWRDGVIVRECLMPRRPAPGV